VRKLTIGLLIGLTVGAATIATAQRVTPIQPRVYSASLTPAATSAAIQTSAQTFTVTGLTTDDKVYVNGPAPQSLCPMVGARVSAANTLQLHFTVLTAAACTPAAGTYLIVATRS
jgi:hypothetical protein